MFFRKAKKIKELESMLSKKESECFDMARDLFQTQQFERIASEKLTAWVQKHDALLIEFKEYKIKHGSK